MPAPVINSHIDKPATRGGVHSFSPGTWQDFRRSIRSGLRTALVFATLCSFGVIVRRVVEGPEAFARVGIRWEGLVVLYYVAFSLGGSAYGALLPLRRALGFDFAAIMSGIIFVAPLYLGAAVLVSPLFSSLQTALTFGLFCALFVGIPLGLYWWDTDREQAARARPADSSRENSRAVEH